MYINNNLTYTYKPSDLKKESNTKNYILEVNTDTLQQYFTGDKGRKNPIMIKPLIKGGGIYGREAGFTAVKTVNKKSPKFIGVFVGVNDYNNPQLKHGVMTYHLLEQMKQMPQDTTLIIKDWFESSTQGVESFINRKYTRSTDDSYKPVQSPEMFGNGKFAIGMVNNQVKESIELAKVKTTIGKIDFKFRSKPGREKETVHQWIYEYLQQNIDPKKMEIAVDETDAYVYTIDGSIWWGDEYVSYDIIKQDQVIKKEIKLEGFNSKSPKQVAKAIAESIIKEIQEIQID